MNKRQVIQHAKNYLDMLAAGTDPISQEAVAEDSVVLRPQMKKCFQFVSAILQEVLENNGLVLLDIEEVSQQARVSVPVSVNGNSYELVRKKAAFRLTAEQQREVLVSRLPITPNEFLKNVNRTVNQSQMEKLSIKSVNAWLRRGGYIAEEKTQTVINKTVWKPTRFAEQIGITEMDISDPKTGEIKRQLMFSTQAQEYLLNHLEEIASEVK
ncbi:MAG: hypothetical protein IJI45_08660 [Anaerolineaceae bacterium]|nr:hypothetical protein [Anaerolineaceae bacterium]